MRDVLYKIMKQVNDPTAFTEMINDVQSQIDKENAAAEQKNVHLDNLRYTLAAAAVEYIEEVFDIKETRAGEKDVIIDEIYKALEDAEADMARTKMFFDVMKRTMPSKVPAKLKKDTVHTCDCGDDCEDECKCKDEPELKVRAYKVPVREDIDVDTVIGEFLKSLS